MNNIGDMFFDAAANGYDNPPMTNRDRNFVQGAYPTSEDDRFVTITIRDDDEWRRAIETMGNPDWAADDRFSTQAGRLAAQDDIDAAFADWTRSRTRQEVFIALQSVGVPAGPIMLEDDVFADPHVKARGFLRENTGYATGAHLYPGHQWKWNGPDMKWEPIGGLGMDNEYVYKEILGFSDEQYAEAEREGHIATTYLYASGNPL
jgi:crotonobetainyl-CoA:carnitine CoA-transferase CaiB-like acyl-CoA transferase